MVDNALCFMVALAGLPRRSCETNKSLVGTGGAGSMHCPNWEMDAPAREWSWKVSYGNIKEQYRPAAGDACGYFRPPTKKKSRTCLPHHVFGCTSPGKHNANFGPALLVCWNSEVAYAQQHMTRLRPVGKKRGWAHTNQTNSLAQE